MRAGYLYSGMADVAALTGDQDYVRAIDSIWEDVVGKKLYITGGIGALRSGRGVRPELFSPNMSAYCETCAAVANDYWNQRLFLLHGDAKYIRCPGAHALQRHPQRRVAGRQTVLLPKPAGVEPATCAKPVVWSGVLPWKHHTIPPVGAGVSVCARGKHALRKFVCSEQSQDQNG